MGLFDKTATCSKCGKPFTKGMLSSDKLCPDCSWVEFVREQQANSITRQREGITQYYKDMPKKFRTPPADIDTILASRNQMLQKYRRNDVMNISLLRNALLTFPEWDHAQMVNFSARVLNALVNTQNNMSFVLHKFVLSHLYDGVAVDADSVFAIAITKNLWFETNITEEPYLCALFTNDPYFPAIGMTFLPVTTKGFLAFESTKNKERVANLQQVLPMLFPNLTYPVMDMKEMKKLVKQEGMVRGSMNFELMVDLLDNGLSSPFWAIKELMPETLPSGIAMSIQNYGYITTEDVFTWLNLNDKTIRSYWAPCFNEASQMIEQMNAELLEYIQSNSALFA